MDHLWAANPGTILYTVDKHGMSKLFYGAAYMHSSSGAFVAVGQQPDPIICGLTGQTPENGVKLACPAMPQADQDKLLASCSAPQQRHPSQIQGNEGYGEVARLGLQAEASSGYGRLPN